MSGYKDVSISLYRVSFVQVVLFCAMVGNKDTENMDPILQEISLIM